MSLRIGLVELALQLTLAIQIGTKSLLKSTGCNHPSIGCNIYKTKSLKLSRHFNIERRETPVCTSLNASFTVEAALIMPLAVTFMVICIFIMHVYVIEAGTQRAIDIVSYDMASTSIDREREPDLAAAIALCDARITMDGIPTRFILGNLAGINYLESDMQGNYIRLTVDYYIVFPIRLYGLKGVHVSQSSMSRKWVGYDISESETGGDYVYVTDHGTVYHLNRLCPYLNPSVRDVNYDRIGGERNHMGGKYKRCEICGGRENSEGNVYVTDYGDVYHGRLNCSALKRTIYRKRLDEVKELGRCDKCGRK